MLQISAPDNLDYMLDIIRPDEIGTRPLQQQARRAIFLRQSEHPRWKAHILEQLRRNCCVTALRQEHQHICISKELQGFLACAPPTKRDMATNTLLVSHCV